MEMRMEEELGNKMAVPVDLSECALIQILWFLNGIKFIYTFDWLPLFHPQGDPLEAVSGPNTNYILKLNKIWTMKRFFDLKVSLDRAYQDPKLCI